MPGRAKTAIAPESLSTATNVVEKKHTLIRRVDDVLLGVGYYTPK